MSDTFSGLLSPSARNRMAMHLDLKSRRDRWPHPTLYKGGADLLLQEGECYEGHVLQPQFENLRGEESQCYDNALAAATADKRLRYCEGVFGTGAGHFTSHAWCVWAGQVVEVTLPTTNPERYEFHLGPGQTIPYLPVDRWSYWGVFFEIELVLALGEVPVLDRPPGDCKFAGMGLDVTDPRTAWPVLEKPYEEGRRGL